MLNRIGQRWGRTQKIILVTLSAVAIWVSASVAGIAAERISLIGSFANWDPKLIQQALDGFTAKTGIQVDLLVPPGWPEMMAKVKTMVAGGVAPDVVYGDNQRIMELAEIGLLKPLDEIATTGGVNLRSYPATVLDTLRVAHRLFSLPTAVSNYATFYNVDKFSNAGLPMIPTDWSSAELNWPEWVTANKKLTRDANGDGKPEQFGVANFGYRGGFNMLGLWNATDIDENRTRYLGTDASVIRALEISTSLWTEHNVAGGDFVKGTAAMTCSQPVYLNSLLQAVQKGSLFNWSIGVLPKGDTRVSPTSFHSLGILAQSKNQTAAWLLVKYLAYERDGNLLFTRAENRVPVLPEAGRDYVRRWNELFPLSNTQVLLDAVPLLWNWRIVSGKGADTILELEKKAFDYIQKRQMSVTEAVHFIAPGIQAALQ